MALGNANTTAQARGKNISTNIKKRKEVDLAASFVQFSHGAKQANVPTACSVSPGDMTLQGWTNNTSIGFPFNTGDYFYTKKRAGSRFYVPDGFYKVGPNAKNSYFSVEIVNGQVVSTPRAVACP